MTTGRLFYFHEIQSHALNLFVSHSICFVPGLLETGIKFS